MPRVNRLTAADQELVTAHLPIAEVVASRLARLGPRDELIAAARYGIVKAALHRPRPEPFLPFAWVSARNQVLIDAERARRRHIGTKQVRPIGRYDPAERPAGGDGLDLDAEDLERLDAAIGRLKPHRARLVGMVLSGLTGTQIAAELGRDRCDTYTQLGKATRTLAAGLKRR